MIEYKFHELCDSFPTLPEDALDALGNDIKKNGLQQKIVLYQEKILDGKNRYLACKRQNVKLTSNDFINLSPKMMPGSFKISMNILRRHIESPAYRIELALKMLEFDKKLKNEPVIEDKNLKKIAEKGENKLIAKAASSDITTVEKARKIIKKIESDPILKNKWEKAKQSKAKITIKTIYEQNIDPPKKKKSTINGVEIPKTPTKIELRQEVEETKEKLELLKKDKHALESFYKKVKEIAERLGYWDTILKELIPIMKKEESSFPTVKQLREAELL